MQKSLPHHCQTYRSTSLENRPSFNRQAVIQRQHATQEPPMTPFTNMVNFLQHGKVIAAAWSLQVHFPYDYTIVAQLVVDQAAKQYQRH